MLDRAVQRARVTFQRKTVTGQNASGEDIYTWTTVQQCLMQISPLALQPREAVLVQQRWADARFSGECAYVPGILTSDRIAWEISATEIRYLDILEAEDPYGTRKTLRLTLREVK